MPTKEQIAKLPKWAQAHISELESDKAVLVSQLEKMEADQPATKIWTDDMVCDGVESRGPSLRRRYFKADRLTICHAGVKLEIHGLYDGGAISLSWRPAGPRDSMYCTGDIFFIPISYQQAKLVCPRESMPDQYLKGQ